MITPSSHPTTKLDTEPHSRLSYRLRNLQRTARAESPENSRQPYRWDSDELADSPLRQYVGILPLFF